MPAGFEYTVDTDLTAATACVEWSRVTQKM